MSVIPTPEMLKAAAQELIDRAEEMVGDGKEVTGIDVWIRLRPNGIPEVTVSKDYTTMRQVQNYLDESRKQSNS